jgi:hypothetical protein
VFDKKDPQRRLPSNVGHFEENLPLSVILCFGGKALVLPGKRSAISKKTHRRVPFKRG